MAGRLFIRWEINFVLAFYEALSRQLFHRCIAAVVIVYVITVIRRDSNIYVWFFSSDTSEVLVDALHTFV